MQGFLLLATSCYAAATIAACRAASGIILICVHDAKVYM